MSLQLYLLRHGETTYSRSGGFCGDLDPDLTVEGEQMAADFAAAYQQDPWEAIYASPMRRTLATAKPLADALGLDIQARDGLKEIRYGEWEGKTHDEVREHYPEDYIPWMTEPAWNPPTGGETSVEIANRAMPVVTEIEERYPTGRVLIVSHKATIRIILCSLLGIDLGRYRDRMAAPAASASIVSFGKYGPLLEAHGDRSHMRAQLRARPGT